MEVEYIWKLIMQLLPSLLFGISASLDALLVGIGYGLRKVRVSALQNLSISLVSLLGTCLSVCLGSRLMLFLPASLADRAGSSILMLLGTYYIIKWGFPKIINRKIRSLETKPFTGRKQSFETEQFGKRKHPASDTRSAEMVRSLETTHTSEITSAENVQTRLKPAETFFLSMTLSLNNIGIGLSASMAGLPLLPAAVTTFLCSALFLLCGNRLGQSRFLRLIGSAADPISGLLLIGLGMIQLVL